jgi:hypothetical protein
MNCFAVIQVCLNCNLIELHELLFALAEQHKMLLTQAEIQVLLYILTEIHEYITLQSELTAL